MLDRRYDKKTTGVSMCEKVVLQASFGCHSVAAVGGENV